MKKVFVEPRIKRIELNMNENIANSGREPAYIVIAGQDCTIYNTGFTLQDVDEGRVTPSDLGNCVIYVDDNAKTKMAHYVTRKQLFGY